MSCGRLRLRSRATAPLVLLVALGAILVAGVPAASASEQLAFLQAGFSPFGPAGAETFAFPTSVAVNQSTGEVFVSDGNLRGVPHPNAVDIFGPEDGSQLASLTEAGGEPFSFVEEVGGIAVDNSCSIHGLTGQACAEFDPSNEDLYVSNVLHGTVDKFKRAGPANYEYVCQFNGWYGAGEEGCHSTPASTAEQFAEPLGVAVDAQGDVYVASYGPQQGAVDEFGPDSAPGSGGKGILSIPGAEHSVLHGHPKYIAVNSTGDIYVLNYESGQAIAELTRSSPTGSVEGEREFEHSVNAIAIDPISNNLYVDYGDHVSRFLPTGPGTLKLEGEFGGGVLSRSEGLAINHATQTIYVSDAEHFSTYAFLEKLVTVPEVEGACSAATVTATAAKLVDAVNPDNASEATYTFEYGTTPYELEAGGPVAGSGFQRVAAEVEGLEPGALYHCRVSATDAEAHAGGIVAHGPDGTFETRPLLPVVEPPEHPTFASNVTTTGATLGGAVVPGSSATHPASDSIAYVHFEYGLAAHDHEHILPSFALAPGEEPTAVRQEIPAGSLQPATEYHFVLIAENAAGEAVGADQIFTTPPAPVPLGRPPLVNPPTATVPPPAGLVQPITLPLLPTPVFPVVKYPPVKKTHKKVKKKPHRHHAKPKRRGKH
jgi:DNA-binding beta-propeller fold protein YncE